MKALGKTRQDKFILRRLNYFGKNMAKLLLTGAILSASSSIMDGCGMMRKAQIPSGKQKKEIPDTLKSVPVKNNALSKIPVKVKEERKIIKIDSVALQKLREAFIDEVNKIRNMPKNRKRATAKGQKAPNEPYLHPEFVKTAQEYAELLATAPDSVFSNPELGHNYKESLWNRTKHLNRISSGIGECVGKVSRIVVRGEIKYNELEKIVRSEARGFYNSPWHRVQILLKREERFPTGVGVAVTLEFNSQEKNWHIGIIVVYHAGYGKPFTNTSNRK